MGEEGIGSPGAKVVCHCEQLVVSVGTWAWSPASVVHALLFWASSAAPLSQFVLMNRLHRNPPRALGPAGYSVCVGGSLLASAHCLLAFLGAEQRVTRLHPGVQRKRKFSSHWTLLVLRIPPPLLLCVRWASSVNLPIPCSRHSVMSPSLSLFSLILES